MDIRSLRNSGHTFSKPPTSVEAFFASTNRGCYNNRRGGVRMTREEMRKKQDVLKRVSVEKLRQLAKSSSLRMIKKNRQAYEALTYK